MTTRWLGRNFSYYETLESTNDAAVAAARRGEPSGTVVVADSQTRGRGRLGRQWDSPPGLNVYFSGLVRPAWPPSDLPPLSLVAAVAICEALAPVANISPTVKWPNDVLVNGRKLAGILVELSADTTRIAHVVIGVGLNVNQTVFSAELERCATSLMRETGRQWDRLDILCRVLERLEFWLDRVPEKKEQALEQWVGWNATIGKDVSVVQGQGWVHGRAVGIDDTGALLVENVEGLHRIVSGDLR